MYKSSRQSVWDHRATCAARRRGRLHERLGRCRPTCPSLHRSWRSRSGADRRAAPRSHAHTHKQLCGSCLPHISLCRDEHANRLFDPPPPLLLQCRQNTHTNGKSRRGSLRRKLCFIIQSRVFVFLDITGRYGFQAGALRTFSINIASRRYSS